MIKLENKEIKFSKIYTVDELIDLAENERLSPVCAELNFKIILGQMYKTIHAIDEACCGFNEIMNHDFVKIFYTPENEKSVIKFNGEKKLIDEIYYIRNRLEKIKNSELSGKTEQLTKSKEST